MGTSTQPQADDVVMPFDELQTLCQQILARLGLSPAHAAAMAGVIAAGQRDACSSHGVYRLVTCARTIRTGQVDLLAEPSVSAPGGPIVRVDAHFGFSPLAFERGLPALVAAAETHGLAALAVTHCFHFSALWPEIERITAHGLAALALTPSHAWVAPVGGRRPVFGTNPIAFGWPRLGPYPFVFDFATSAVARGDLELHRRADTPLPEGAGVDASGQPSTDAQAVAAGAMLAFGGHKGSALAAMVELMAGALIGDWTSREALAFAADESAAPCHGELLLAFDPAQLTGGDIAAAQARAETLFEDITSQGARLPSQRRYAARARSLAEGVRIPRALFEEISSLGRHGAE